MLLTSSINALDSCLPCLEVDGTFIKHPSYNGVCILVISKNGDHKNVPIAITMVPSETTDNYIRLFLNMKACGIPFDNLAVFSDRVKQMNAAKRLYKFGCNWLHIKNCTYHIANNVCYRYSNRDFELKNMISGLQSSVSMIGYIKTLIEITKKDGEFKKILTTLVEWSMEQLCNT
jgi:MULE transposase domain